MTRHPAWNPRIVGFAGFAHSGKDTAADHLVSDFGYVKVSWADKLREAAAALNPIVGWEPDNTPVRYVDLLQAEGYLGAKLHPEHGDEFRGTLIRMGTEMGRNVFGENFWVDLLMASLDPAQHYVIPDTRFPNEAQAIKSAGGVVIRIERPGVNAVVDHPSETALADWPYDGIMQNGGSIADLYAELDYGLTGQREPLGYPIHG
jgi:hypothetical protein